MNYISCIIQILEIPIIKSYSDNIEMVEFRVQLPSVRNKKQFPVIISSQIWGDLRYDLVNYYKVNDYALIEGYLSPKVNNKNNKLSITINIIKLYPFLLISESKQLN